MAKPNLALSKGVIQSYLITSARYDFSVYEKRILYRIVELIQAELKGKPLGQKIRIQPNLYDDKNIVMPISHFFIEGDKNRHGRIREALFKLRERGIERKNPDGSIVGYSIVMKYKVPPRHEGEVNFTIARELYEDLLDFAKGYSQYELQVAFSFRSQYTMRLYELTCKQKEDIVYSIDRLREMFCLEHRYKLTKDFIKKVIDPAQRELEKSGSAYYFTYEKLKTGRAIDRIRFVTHYRSEQISSPPLLKIVEEGGLRNLIDFLNARLGTTDKNWVSHKSILLANLEVPKEGRPQNELDKILEGAQYADNPVGYVINALKRRVEQSMKQ